MRDKPALWQKVAAECLGIALLFVVTVVLDG